MILRAIWLEIVSYLRAFIVLRKRFFSFLIISTIFLVL